MIQFLKQFTPPIIIRILKFRFSQGWHGRYKSWDDARKRTTGYEADSVIDRVRAAALKAKNKEVAYERSAITYDEPKVHFPLLTCLFYAAQQHNNQIEVLDYGGALGSVYYQLKPYLGNLSTIRWNIVEQPAFVKVGREEFEDDELHFFESIEQCLEVYEPSVLIFSGSLQYLPEPFKTLEKIFSYEIPYIFFDLTAFIDEDDDRITIQKVPPAYYNASYPCWFFSKSKFLAFMSSHYKLIDSFKDEVYLELDLKQLRYEGMWFERKVV